MKKLLGGSAAITVRGAAENQNSGNAIRGKKAEVNPSNSPAVHDEVQDRRTIGNGSTKAYAFFQRCNEFLFFILF